MKICQNCEKEITVEGRSKFCSADCQVVFYNKVRKLEEIKEVSNVAEVPNNKIIHEKTKKVIIKVCEICGKEYEAKVNHAKHCSKRCSYFASYKNKPFVKYVSYVARNLGLIDKQQNIAVINAVEIF